MRSGQRLSLLESHPQYAQALGIARRLRELGHATVLAGGCVRDALMGRLAGDLDLATAAPPEAVEAAFPRTLAVGKAFGTIVVVEDGHGFEVTTFRREGPYLDGRRPAYVEFTDMREDARRRDFTVNALFYDPLGHEVLDFVGGIEDLGARRLRTVGEPEARFGEDRLRMLRGVRFVARLGFALDAEALAAIRRQHAALAQVSVERIAAEMKKLLGGEFLRAGIECLLASRLAEVFWPELTRLDMGGVSAWPRFQNWENAYAALSRLVNAADPAARLRSWKMSRESQRRVEAQLAGLKVFLAPDSTRAQRARALGEDVYAEILTLARLELDDASIEARVRDYLKIAGPDGRLPPPLLTGEDLLKAGYRPGAEMGRVLKEIYDAQLEGRVTDLDGARRMIPAPARAR